MIANHKLWSKNYSLESSWVLFDSRLIWFNKALSAALTAGKYRLKEDTHNTYYFSMGLTPSLMHPHQALSVCLLDTAHPEEQHHQLGKVTVLSQPIRGEVTLLLFPPSAVQRGNPCQAVLTADHLLSQTTGSSWAKARGQLLPIGGAPSLGCGSLYFSWLSTWAIWSTESTLPWRLSAGCGRRAVVY